MKFEDAVLYLLINKKAKIDSTKAEAYSQNLSSIKYWLFKDIEKEQNWEKFMKSDDWTIKEPK